MLSYHIQIDRQCFKEKQIAKFWSHVDRQGPNECWLWKGSKTCNKYGGGVYGIWRCDSNSYRPHRVAWTLEKGPLEDKITLDHLIEGGICSSTLCCNPAHLEPVTLAENLKRWRASEKFAKLYRSGVCKHGHEREPGKSCRKCATLSVARSQAKKPTKYRLMKNKNKRDERAASRARIIAWNNDHAALSLGNGREESTS